MTMIEPCVDDDDDDDSEDPLDFPGFARARIVSVHHAGGATWCDVAYIDEPDGGLIEMGTAELRIIDQYEAARRRQSEAQALAERRWSKPAPPPAPAAPATGKLTARQEEFCRRYVAQPVATRAAILAGYSEDSAATMGSRLLKHPFVLERIARLRAESSLHYVLERDTLHDKLEAVFFEALDGRNHAAAIAALRLQAGLGGMLRAGAPGSEPAAPPAPRSAREKTRGRRRKVEKSRGRRGPKVEKSRVAPARKVKKSR